MKLSVVIINYKSITLIQDCLSSFLPVSGINLEVIIVNNDTGISKTTEPLSGNFDNLLWIDMGYNAGFARANNVGIRAATGDTVLLLNPDTLIIDNAITDCYKTFITSKYVACGVQLLYEDGTPQIAGNYVMKGGLNYLLPLPYTGPLLKAIAQLFKVKKPNIQEASKEEEVDWINGAFLMVKKGVIIEAGLLDEDFFLYAEEAEWCSRLKSQGPLCIFGQYKVTHLQGKTANETFGTGDKGYFDLYTKKGLQIIVSNFVRIRKEFGVAWYLFQLLGYTFTIPVFCVGLLLHNCMKFRNPFKHFSMWWGFCKNVIKLWTLTPTIIHNKPYFYKML